MTNLSDDEALPLAAQQATDFLAGLAQRPVAAAAAELPDFPEGIGTAAALAWFRDHLEPGLSASNGPRYFGFVTGGASPAALAGDWLAAAYNQNASHDVGSNAAAIERATAARFAALFGLDAAMQGHFVSGATAANVVALATARQSLHRRAGIDSAQVGLHAAPPLRILGGAPHSSIAKAAAILGLGRAAVQTVATLPGRTAVDPAALAAALRADPMPTIVVASAGEVNTGDFDDLAAVAAACRAHGAWLHVDGAFGLFAAFSPAHAPRLAGIELADSVTVDLHKWLNVPYDGAIAYTRTPDAQREVFRASAAYLGDTPDPLHFVPENSRRFRALPAWMALAAYGPAGIAAAVERNCMQASALADGIAAIPGLDLLDPVRLNIVCFAPSTPGAEARDRLLAWLVADGRLFLTPTVLHGRPALRLALSNWRTGADDVAIVLQALRDAVAATA
jgi:glutamate/tyrosine decarboxylase-like PLP-dependent enzyme